MIESEDYVDPVTGLPVYSLYGKVRTPTDEMLKDVETLIVDLQDVGTRIYTFASTMAACMRAAAEKEIQVVITDRPNPIGGIGVEGNVLEENCYSFVGEFPIPMRHGMTMGELAKLLNASTAVCCDLDVTPMNGWRRSYYWDDLELEWIAPSPNIPSLLSATVYPGTVIFEGTNISEGRGTTRPFELIGAPFINSNHLATAMNSLRLPGVHFRPVWFEPTFHKWHGEKCGGIQLHVRDRNSYKAYVTGLLLLETIRSQWPNEFSFSEPPYEYEYDRRPIDLIVGSCELMDQLQKEGREVDRKWQAGLNLFQMKRNQNLMYQ